MVVIDLLATLINDVQRPGGERRAILKVPKATQREEQIPEIKISYSVWRTCDTDLNFIIH